MSDQPSWEERPPAAFAPTARGGTDRRFPVGTAPAPAPADQPGLVAATHTGPATSSRPPAAVGSRLRGRRHGVDAARSPDQAPPRQRPPTQLADPRRAKSAPPRLRPAPVQPPAPAKSPKNANGYQPPQWGWRKWLYLLLFRTVNIRPSDLEVMLMHQHELTYRLEELDVLASGAQIIVLQSQKGGQGKTTVSLLLGMMFKWIWRQLSVVVVDGNPDRGTLRDIIPPVTISEEMQAQGIRPTAISLFAYMAKEKITEIRNREFLLKFMRIADLGLHVLPLAESNADAKKVSKEQFNNLLQTLRRFIELLIVDLGTGFRESTSSTTFGLGHLLVMVTTPKPADMNVALDNFAALLEDHPALARKAVLVVNMAMPTTDLDKIRSQFAARFGDDFTGVAGDPSRPGVPVLAIPFSKHLDQGRLEGFDPGTGEEVRSPVVFYDDLEEEVRTAVWDLAGTLGERMATRPDGTLASNPLSIHRNNRVRVS